MIDPVRSYLPYPTKGVGRKRTYLPRFIGQPFTMNRSSPDPRNGLALCAIHDRAFDRGLIGLDESLRLILSDRLTEIRNESGIHEAIFQAFAGKPIDLPYRFLPDPEAIEYHRNHVFLTR